MKRSLANHTIDIEQITSTLMLDNVELLEQVSLQLHQNFNSYCSCIVEINKSENIAHTLAYACGGEVINNFNYSLENTPCETVRQATNDHCLYTEKVYDLFPEDAFLRECGIESYLGVPLKAHNGEIMGILLSTFEEPLDDTAQLLYCHHVYANIIVHTLRERWLSERSNQLFNQLSHEVSHDNLTGLLNRSCLADKLELMTQQLDQPFSLAFVDIDNFKAINDLYGNYIGDQIIKFTAKNLLRSVPDPNLVFRIAGDEFAFITFSDSPIEMSEELISSISQGYTDSAHQINFSVSIGIARTSNNQVSADQLILNASLALKDCKQYRDTHIQCYDTHLSAQYHRKTQIIEAMRNELEKPIEENSEIYVVVQPIVNNNRTEWNYFEVLCRWDSAEYGSISPIEFIEAAEQSGLIVPLGQRIIELACQAKQILEQGLGYKVKFGINCSANELSDSSQYLSNLLHTIRKYHFTPPEFTIELTETVLLTQSGGIEPILNDIRHSGFTVALDDFGTGYSSLNYIHSYPIDCIKIDASFIRNMMTNKSSEHVVSLIIQLARHLDVDLVAEGVEHLEALNKLYSMGCHQIQGYYFSRPERPLTIIEQWKNLNQIRRA
ncbi:putative bifunctional diguanylate cyclase/phosphodiesterase [Vibrio cortegadensis]|uniref:putative bifunctional diguanylate cyclase/phosphodiesterase n=1 Tax=Vibrio cortegadensis TaxID=1328770 RepID=UPI00352DA5E0